MSLTTEENSHTNADYRCKIVVNKYSHFMAKVCSIEKNYGSKRGLFIPRKNFYVKKSDVIQNLDVNDYFTAKLSKDKDKRSLVVDKILNTTLVHRANNKEDNTNKNITEKSVLAKKLEPVNRFSLLMDSSDEEEED